MSITRRSFLKVGAALAAVGVAGFDYVKPLVAQAKEAKLQWTKVTTSVCCFCAVGCGLLVHTGDKAKGNATDRTINIEGDPDHPINQGSLCAKGAASIQVSENEARPKSPLYRAPNSKEWKEVSWEWTIQEIAKRVKKTRDASFTAKNDKGQVVNRTLAMASFGSAALDNEECWALQAFMRSLGLVYIEHQARL